MKLSANLKSGQEQSSKKKRGNIRTDSGGCCFEWVGPSGTVFCISDILSTRPKAVLGTAQLNSFIIRQKLNNPSGGGGQEVGN